MNLIIHTHRISVNAFLICNDRFLLLKRSRNPLIWGPPGGHLLPDEDPVEGLQREIFEETHLKAEIVNPVVTWFGEFNKGKLLSIDLLGTTSSSDVILSEEHTAFRRISIWQLQKEPEIYFNSNIGFTLDDFILAWRFYLLIENRLEELAMFSRNQ